MNYIIKDEQKYARICLDNFNEQLTPVNDSFRIIILVDREFLNKADIAFLHRFEKANITFNKLLDNENLIFTPRIMNEINFKYIINEYQKQVNYSLKDLLINCGEEQIQSLIYIISIDYQKNYNNKIDEEELKEKIYNKISKMLPQDIVCILPDNNIIKKKYIENKKYYNLKDYINDTENMKYKISIIYTFNSITNIIDGINKENSFMISEIKSENQLNNIINKIKNKNNKNLKIII